MSDDDLGRLEEFGLVAPSHTARDRVLFDEDALGVARCAARSCSTASSRATSACTARSPTGKRACSSRCCCRTAGSATRRRRRARPRRSATAGLGRRLRTALLRQAVRRYVHGLTWRRRSCSTPPRIATQVRRLGQEIARDHPDGVVLVGVLKGALIFLADLGACDPDIDVDVDFMSISRFAPDSGRVRILHDLEHDISGRDVVIVEDIVDTGLTLAYLLGQLRRAVPRPPLDVRAARPAGAPHRARKKSIPRASSSTTSTSSATGCTFATCTATCLRRAADRDTLVARPDAYVADLYRTPGSAPRPVVG